MSNDRLPLSMEEITLAALAAVDALRKCDLDSCLFGSAACAMYGMNNRTPNDVDVIVLTETPQEEIKDLIVSKDPSFSLVKSKDPSATYRILWYKLPALRYDPNRVCKVDVLSPGHISIPHIPLDRITLSSPSSSNPDISVPLTPFVPLLFLKLKGWADHLIDARAYVREKLPQDVDDIEALLKIGVDKLQVHRRMEPWMPKWFVNEAKSHAELFVKEWPGTAGYWRDIGLNVY